MDYGRGAADIFSTAKDQFFLEGLGDSDRITVDPQGGHLERAVFRLSGISLQPSAMLMGVCLIDKEVVMKASATIVCICLTALLISGGRS